MSRLAEAETKFEAALQQLEAVLANRPAAEANSGTTNTSSASSGAGNADAGNADAGNADAANAGEMVDRAAIIAEIGRIDEQLINAMQMIDRVRHASGGEGGTA
jgi:hypothetical protein